MALNVRFAPDSDQIADIAEGLSCATSGHGRPWYHEAYFERQRFLIVIRYLF